MCGPLIDANELDGVVYVNIAHSVSAVHIIILYMNMYIKLLFSSQGLFEWLKSAELRSTEEFMVGTDLESVKEQLCDLKVSSYSKCSKHLEQLTKN